MRRLLIIPFLLLVAAKGGKKNKNEPAPEPAPVEVAAPPVEEPAPPPPPPEPVVVRNANFNISFTFADGSTKSGHVIGVERGEDFNADQGWTTEDGKLKLTLEVGSSEKNVAWSDVKSINIVPGKVPDDVDCTYSSDFNPWMYECTLRTTAQAVLKDGSKGNITTRHRWRFTFEDQSTFEFQVFKYTLREQDSKDVEYGSEQAENFGIYTKLQDQLRTDMKGGLIKSISVN